MHTVSTSVYPNVLSLPLPRDGPLSDRQAALEAGKGSGLGGSAEGG